MKSAYWEAVRIFDKVLQAFDIQHAKTSTRPKRRKKKEKGRENEARQLPCTIWSLTYTLNSVLSHLWQPKHVILWSFVVLTWMRDIIELV